MIIGEQQIALEVRHRCAGIMLQPLQREIGARRIKQSQRTIVIWLEQFAIGNLVTNVAKRWRWEPFCQISRADLVQSASLALIPDIGVRNFRCRQADFNLDIIIAEQRLQLLHQIMAVKFWLRHGRRVSTRLGHFAECARNWRRRSIRVVVNDQFRIAECASRPGIGIRRLTIFEEILQRIAERVYRRCVELFQLINYCFWCF